VYLCHANEGTQKFYIMLQSTIINRIHGLQIAFDLNTELGLTTRAEMNQAAIDRLTLLIK
jgi:hypothetical protein